MKTTATFVTSAASAGDLPRDGLPEVAMVGRSNVGKSSLINALVRQKIARTSSTPGKTRLANIYRVERASSAPFYLVDLPGFGYARAERGSGSAAAGRAKAQSEFSALTAAYFGRAGQGQAGQVGRVGQVGQADLPDLLGLLLVDSRHPGLQNDLEAWSWLRTATPECAVVATKIDKLARGERIRAMREMESVLEHSVLPVSAVTGEGLDELWNLIDRLANSRTPRATATRATATRPTAPTNQTAPTKPPTARTRHRKNPLKKPRKR